MCLQIRPGGTDETLNLSTSGSETPQSSEALDLNALLGGVPENGSGNDVTDHLPGFVLQSNNQSGTASLPAADATENANTTSTSYRLRYNWPNGTNSVTADNVTLEGEHVVGRNLVQDIRQMLAYAQAQPATSASTHLEAIGGELTMYVWASASNPNSYLNWTGVGQIIQVFLDRMSSLDPTQVNATFVGVVEPSQGQEEAATGDADAPRAPLFYVMMHRPFLEVNLTAAEVAATNLTVPGLPDDDVEVSGGAARTLKASYVSKSGPGSVYSIQDTDVAMTAYRFQWYTWTTVLTSMAVAVTNEARRRSLDFISRDTFQGYRQLAVRGKRGYWIQFTLAQGTTWSAKRWQLITDLINKLVRNEAEDSDLSPVLGVRRMYAMGGQFFGPDGSVIGTWGFRKGSPTGWCSSFGCLGQAVVGD
ncbi:MAG: hypothetical protein M1838_000224 [Thelocarpon superellum]|nr:MAG: hypothetical protein M1838_000224 [Thelocarpon superellum]